MYLSKKYLLSLALISIVFVHGCGGDESEDLSTTVSPTLESVYSNIIQGCSSAGLCHSSGVEPLDGPDWSIGATNFYSNSVGVTAAEFNWAAGSENCQDAQLINPGSAQASLIVGIVDEAVSQNFPISGCVPSFSNHAAVHKVSISSGALSALKEWVDAGASQ